MATAAAPERCLDQQREIPTCGMARCIKEKRALRKALRSFGVKVGRRAVLQHPANAVEPARLRPSDQWRGFQPDAWARPARP